MDDFGRAREYVRRMPAAISGQGGHQAAFAVARALVHGFALPLDKARVIMDEYNLRCSPPWKDCELNHKLQDAQKLTRVALPVGHLLSRGPRKGLHWPAVGKIGALHRNAWAGGGGRVG